jgi:hypothetical protein
MTEDHLTTTEAVCGDRIANFQRDTAPGMAHWAGSGPANKFCTTCKLAEWNGYYANKPLPKPITCAKYRAMMGKAIPYTHGKKACRFYEKGGAMPKRP